VGERGRGGDKDIGEMEKGKKRYVGEREHGYEPGTAFIEAENESCHGKTKKTQGTRIGKFPKRRKWDMRYRGGQALYVD
jgi:hypothetical protein